MCTFANKKQKTRLINLKILLFKKQTVHSNSGRPQARRAALPQQRFNSNFNNRKRELR